jgi:hypothetical protein
MSDYWRAQTKEQLENCFRYLREHLPENGWRVEYRPWKDKRSLSQNDFQHAIYADISKYLISKGRDYCTPKWVKEALKNQFLGWEQKEFVDLRTGEVTVREVLRSTADLDTGEAVHYTDQILAWAADIGCDIKIPTVCDYRQYKEAQHAA